MVGIMERLRIADIHQTRRVGIRRIREGRVLKVRRWTIGNLEVRMTLRDRRVTRFAEFRDT
jgi:hypothetical protein